MLTRPKPFSPPLLSLALRLLHSSKTLIPRAPRTLKSRATARPSAVESICSLLSSSSDPSQTLDDLLKDFKPKLTSDLVLDILRSHRQLGRSRTLQFFSWAGSHLGFRFDDAVVEYVAGFLAQREPFDDLKRLLKTVAANNGRVSTRTVLICIWSLGRQGRVLEALAIFEMMELELNCYPDNLVFNSVLYLLCKTECSGGMIDVALTIFRRIGQPDANSYSSIIVGLCVSGRLENALQMFDEMQRCNLAPRISVANALIGQLCEIGGRKELVDKVQVKDWRRPFDILVPNIATKSATETAFEVFRVVTKLGLLPSSHVVTKVILELCRWGKIDEAIEILNVLESRKPLSINVSYAIVIRALCGVRRIDEACNLFGRMIHLGLKPKLTVYNAIICALCKLGNVVDAQSYFETMNKMKCEPDGATYTMLIHAYCKVQDLDTAYRLMMEMVGLGLKPHYNTSSLVDGLLRKNCRIDLSLKLERKMEVQILHLYCKEGRFEAAYDKLNSMIAKGFYPPVYARDAFERAFQGSSRWKIAKDLLAKMDDNVIQKIAQA
ncbi:uncharacterized protein [Typha angustifolia]|uniref:uncharacterized protein n=1 Tax=Typha angustifolia TaxID=59011 RepID=UPI003C2C9F05